MLLWGWWIFTDSIFNADLEVIINALSKSWWKNLTGNLSNDDDDGGDGDEI